MVQTMFQDILGRLNAGEDLSMDEMSSVIDLIMCGEVGEEQMGLLLTALKAKGETIEEVAGAATAMRKHMTHIHADQADLVDTCGTGGAGSGTFNISTAAAIVTAAAGVPVAKHGNRAMSGTTGSADVLAELGVNIEASLEAVEKCLKEAGICFCFAQQFHRSMKHVAPVRRKLGFPTIFNLLGPLCNPAGAGFQVLGVGRPEIRELIAGGLARLGTTRAVVVHGEDGLCEVTLSGRTFVTLIEGGQLSELTWTAEDFGLAAAQKDTMLVDGPAASAAIIRDILAGQPGPTRDIVVANAAAALWVTGRGDSLAECARLAGAAIDSGAADQRLARLREVSQS